jgi:hypothetical protein
MELILNHLIQQFIKLSKRNTTIFNATPLSKFGLVLEVLVLLHGLQD